MSEFINAITKGIPPAGAIGCCVCGDKNITLLVRNSKRICRKCYSEYLKEKNERNMEMKDVLCTIFGLIGAGIAKIFGGWSDGLTTLLIFMGVDYVTGLLLAVMGRSKNTETGHLSSGACWRGLVKKGVCLLIVLVGCRLDLLSGTTYIRDATVVAFCVSEVISILENASLMGVPIPAVITNAIDLLKTNETGEITKPEPDQDGGV